MTPLLLGPATCRDCCEIKKNRSAVASFRCLTAMPPEGSAMDGILPGWLDRGCREAEIEFEPWTLQSVNLRSNH
ncbi:hypothetical protein T265_04565 [Opisthorchis viverrini]|uniref:Uncharacterized protein n=1 Tax=Opisthorchis viverrini TaxID=6198 RepID=A0A074ZNC7_OPIVI|nr:hypothetical protein T265_04565 [Opisthorchis viverrini]KER28611.1 hypothetical protein T265_04565 [Opisthorchis viverrini]